LPLILKTLFFRKYNGTLRLIKTQNKNYITIQKPYIVEKNHRSTFIATVVKYNTIQLQKQVDLKIYYYYQKKIDWPDNVRIHNYPILTFLVLYFF